MSPVALEKATQLLAHRGPDGQKTWIHSTGLVGLGHTRLAIIDIAGGEQPMSSTDSRMTAVFNGEIYNYRELRTELETLGYVCRTSSDTEVLLNAYRAWGSESLIRLNGMFAFAIFDGVEQKLFLARDRTGIKPLYYYAGAQGLAFASELKALFAWRDIPRKINASAVMDSLMLSYPIAPATCFRDCNELQPGSFLEISDKGTRTGSYWKWKRESGVPSRTNWIDLAEHELQVAVREHLVSDVPVGAFLSGGIDSSLLVALIAAGGGPRLHTFTVKFGESAYDESPYAKMVAEKFGTEHHELSIDNRIDNVSLVEKVLDQFDQPFGDSSAIPTYLISQVIREHVKVVIGGDGGDEMFGGYPRFLHADAISLMGRAPMWLLRSCENVLVTFSGLPSDLRRQGARLLRAAQQPGQQKLITLCSIFPKEELLRAFQPEFEEALGSYHPYFATLNGNFYPGGDELMDATIATALPGDYLRKVDVMSSAHGLEVRVPMLANRILDLSAKIPNRQKYSWRMNKIILRRLADKYLPDAVASKPKQGFGIPLDRWLGRQGRNAVGCTLLAKTSLIRQIIRPQYLDMLVGYFVTQHWDHAKLARYSLYQRIYALWSLERWLQRWNPTF
jgi:asparagine synthase (glutamine-hydrolysing)